MRSAATLAAEFVGVYLPLLAQRFARERLLAARLVHPLGSGVDSVRSARDEIRERVEALIGSLRTVAR